MNIKAYTTLTLLTLLFTFIMSCSPESNVDFPKKPCLEPTTNNSFKLCKPLVAMVNDDVVVVPAGFETDLASIPRALWFIHSPTDSETISPAILHDFMYSCPGKYSRRTIDSIFYSSLIDNLVNPIVAYEYWLAVRLAVSSHFNTGTHCATTDTPAEKISD